MEKLFRCVCFRLRHLCGGGYAQEPLALRQWKRTEADAGIMQDFVRQKTSRGAPAGHQELPSPVRVTLFRHGRSPSLAKITDSCDQLISPAWMESHAGLLHSLLFLSIFVLLSTSSDCLLSDAESSSSDSPVADKRAPGSERAAERAAQQNERERIRLGPQTTFANIQVIIYKPPKWADESGGVQLKQVNIVCCLFRHLTMNRRSCWQPKVRISVNARRLITDLFHLLPQKKTKYNLSYNRLCQTIPTKAGII